MTWIGYGPVSMDYTSELQLADEVGLDGVLIPEHHGFDKWPCQSLLTAFHIGLQTKRIQVGTAPILLPLYHPVHVAEQMNYIQTHLGGRLLLGVAGGWSPEDFAHFGVSLSDRATIMDESLEILTRARVGEMFEFAGTHYTLSTQRCTPVPEQPVPIWLCSGSAASVRRAAQAADAVVLQSSWVRDEVQRHADLYRRTCEEVGRTPSIVLMRRAWLGSRSEAMRLVRETFDTYKTATSTAFPAHLTERSESYRATGDGSDLVLAGDVDAVVAQVVEWIEDLGLDGIQLRLPFILEEPDMGMVREQLIGFGEVANGVRKALASTSPRT